MTGLARFLVLAALATTLGLLVSCEERSSRAQGRAGVAVALEARHTAANVAAEIANQVDGPCGHFEIEGPLTVTTDLTLEGFRGEELALRLSERRTLEVDGDGGVRLIRLVEYVGEHRRTGSREHEWRILGGHVFYRHDNLPFEGRQIDVVEATRLTREGTAAFESLVRATREAWSTVERTETGWHLTAAADGTFGERIRCGNEAVADPWLRDLEGRLSVRAANARVVLDVAAHPVQRLGEWTMGPVGGLDEPLIRVSVDERVVPGPLADAIEPPDVVADLRRNRLHHSVAGFLLDLDVLLSRSDEAEEIQPVDGTGLGVEL